MTVIGMMHGGSEYLIQSVDEYLYTTKTVALLQFYIYLKPMFFLSKPIEGGKMMETKGSQAYVKRMQMHGHPGLQMTRFVLVAHPVKGWLEVSPDGSVTDPSERNVHGILESVHTRR